MKTRYFFFFSVLLFFCMGCSSDTKSDESWRLVYRHDADGNALYGDKSELIAAVRNGLPVRLGFGGRGRTDTSRSVEHLADVQFLTILDNTEVFGQIEQIIGQAPAREEDGNKVRFRTHNTWTKIAGTNGYSVGLMVDYINDSIPNLPGDRKQGASWFVFSKRKNPRTAKPLYD